MGLGGGYWLRLGLICKAPKGTNSRLAPVVSEGGERSFAEHLLCSGHFFSNWTPPHHLKLLLLQICYITAYVLYGYFILYKVRFFVPLLPESVVAP